ncbi:MAG: DNA glycosylase [Oscillospiraceae bacterium]|nr:DNA glycosylase [Oscillospiraceae bacterium]
MEYLQLDPQGIRFRTGDLSLEETLACGQCFRWKRLAPGVYEGAARGYVCRIAQAGDLFTVSGVEPRLWETVWAPYFDLDRDYAALKARFCAHPILAKAVDFAPGIRVLRQEPWEALCTFIISQNNNIGRITGIVERLCDAFGEPLTGGWHAFPSPEKLAGLDVEALSPLRSGFRARYLLDAAKKTASGEVDLARIADLPLDEGRAALMRICGVGRKVADCALLYGFGRVDCVPVDVWVRRVLERLFPDGLPEFCRGEEGIAQQYLFHYARTCPGALETP